LTEGKITITASGNRGATIQHMDGDGNNHSWLANVAAAASACAAFPNLGTTPSTSAAISPTGLILAPPEYTWSQIGSAAQTETAIFTASLQILGNWAAPTVIWTDSAGTPNAAAATENTFGVMLL
jgi:hypothetical protein